MCETSKLTETRKKTAIRQKQVRQGRQGRQERQEREKNLRIHEK